MTLEEKTGRYREADQIPEFGLGGLEAGSRPVYKKLEWKMVRCREAGQIPESGPGGLEAQSGPVHMKLE